MDTGSDANEDKEYNGKCCISRRIPIPLLMLLFCFDRELFPGFCFCRRWRRKDNRYFRHFVCSGADGDTNEGRCLKYRNHFHSRGRDYDPGAIVIESESLEMFISYFDSWYQYGDLNAMNIRLYGGQNHFPKSTTA